MSTAPTVFVRSKEARGPDAGLVRYQMEWIKNIYQTLGPTEFSTRTFWILRKNTEEGEVDLLPSDSELWNRRLVPFVHNKIQVDLDNNIIVAGSKRNIMLKPRQAGYTTWSIIMRLLLPALIEPGTSSMLISQNAEYAQAHFDIMKRAWRFFFVADPYNEAENDWAISLRKNLLHVAYSNRRELIFDQLDSRVRCASAEVEEVGQGLCTHPLTWIEVVNSKVNRNIIRYKKLLPGMKVVGSDGLPVEIERVFEVPAYKHPYKGQAVKVSVWGATSFATTVAPNHPFQTQRGLVEARTLRKSDFIEYSYPKLKTTTVRKAIFSPSRLGKYVSETVLDSDFGLLCGLYLADGCVFKQKDYSARSLALCIMRNERKMNYALERLTVKVNSIVSNGCKLRGKWFQINSKGLVDWVDEMFGRAKNKHLPDWWRSAPKEFLFGLFEGYMCGDGHWHRKGIDGSGKNPTLVLGMRDLAAAIGLGLPNLAIRNRRTKPTVICGVACMNRGRQYRLGVGGIVWERFCQTAGIEYKLKTHLRKKSQYYRGDKIYLPVAWTKKTRCKKFLDITVKSSDHLYRLPIGLTHNTINHLCATELSRWDHNPEETMANVKEAIAADGTLDIECTPNGLGGYFYEEWNRAINVIPGKQREFKPHFHTWWWHEEYRRIPGIELTDMTEEERTLVRTSNLDGRQIAWRREKIESLRHNFAEKYPEDDVSCFLTSGSSFFEKEIVARRIRELSNFVPLETRNKFVRFSNPVKHRRYIIGADPAEGIPVTTENPDYSAAVLIDQDTGEEVVAYRAHVLPEEFAEHLVELAREYNDAQIAVEYRSSGPSVIMYITYQLGYWNLYKHMDWFRKVQLSEGNTKSQQQQRLKEKLGFPTDTRNRPIALNRARWFVSNMPHLIWDIQYLKECSSFIYNEKGKPEAQKGAHDDTVLARAIAYYARAVANGEITPESIRKREKYGAVPTELAPKELIQ